MSEQAMEEALDEIEQKLEEGVEQEQQEEIQEPTEQLDTKHEHMSYQEWVDDGRDPDDYRGKKAFDNYGKLLVKTEENSKQLQQAIEGINSWKVDQEKREQERVDAKVAEAKSRLEQAKEDEDTNAALKAYDDIQKLNTKTAEQPQAAPMGPKLSKFVSDRPMIDPSNPQFDSEIGDVLARLQNANLDRISNGNHGILTDDMIARSLAKMYTEVQSYYPEKFKSTRNTRQATPQSKPRSTPSAPDYRSKLKGFGVNPKNKNDQNPALDTYDMIYKIDKKKAEVFAKSVLGES